MHIPQRWQTVEIEPTSQISWKQVAIQKQTRLITGAEGETVREAVETIMPVLYTQAGNKVEAQPLASSKRVNVSV